MTLDWAIKIYNNYKKDKAANEKQAEIIIEQENIWSKNLDDAILDACIKEYGTKADKEYCMVTESVSKEEFESRYINDPEKFNGVFPDVAGWTRDNE